MAVNDHGAEHSQSLWRLIHLAEFRAPRQPAREALRLSLRSLWDRLRFGTVRQSADTFEAPELVSVPSALIDRLTPDLDWSGRMDDLLKPLLQESEPNRARDRRTEVLVAPPYCRLQSAVADWAVAHGHRVVEAAPAIDEISHVGDVNSWEEVSCGAEDLLVIPALERCFVRHHRGFDRLRRLVDALWRARPHCIVVCDSWAWAMLKHVSPIHHLASDVWTLAPLDATRFEQWVAQTVEANFARPLTLRRSDTGKKAVRLNSEGDEGALEYLSYLAAHARGNPDVAAHIWQQSLSIAAGDRDAEINKAAHEEAASDQGRTVWVSGWDKVVLPSLPGGTDMPALFTLHALLLHNGLDEASLRRVLGTSVTDHTGQLAFLMQEGLIHKDRDRWRVVQTAYPAVRARLDQEGFLTDAL